LVSSGKLLGYMISAWDIDVNPKKVEAIKQDLMVIDEPKQEPAYDWINPIKMFLENQPPSDNNAEVGRIVRKSKQYHLVDEILF
jgi:hypothetical protein